MNDDLSNKHLLMSLLSTFSREKTVMITTSPLSVQDVINALDNGNKSQPKVCRLSDDRIVQSCALNFHCQTTLPIGQLDEHLSVSAQL